jgi:hypothetical protein
MRNTADVTGGKPIATVESAINPLVAFYDIHGGNRKVLFFYLLLFGLDTLDRILNIS